jgi:tetratricopeptide (TPR) repeat protein
MKNVDRPNNGRDKQEKAQNPHGTYSLFADLNSALAGEMGFAASLFLGSATDTRSGRYVFPDFVGCVRETEAALRATTRVDPTFADAWYDLSDLLDEQGRVEAAIECLCTTLRVAPDYADAMFNLALLLQRTNQYAEAADYWRRYLASDCQSEWAVRARRSLKFCEMQLHLVASAAPTRTGRR